MTDRDALWAAIVAHPDEDTPRLAFADWLDENAGAAGRAGGSGGAAPARDGAKEDAFRADFIRTHCRLARLEPYSPAWRDLNAHWLKLRDRVGRLAKSKRLPWVAHLKGRVRAWDFERGLVGHVTVYAKRFVAEGGRYFEQDPVRSVKFVTLASAQGSVRPAELFACAHLARAARLDFEGSNLKDKDLALLAASPHLGGLRSLGLGGDNPFTRAALPRLLKALAALSELDLGTNRGFDHRHAAELAACPELARLTSLDLSATEAGPAGTRAVVTSPHATNLAALYLSADLLAEDEDGYPVSAQGMVAAGREIAEAVAGSKSLARLQELDLSYHPIGDEGLRALAGSKGLPALRRLRLSGTGITMAGVKALAGSPLGRQLLFLDLAFNPHLHRRWKEARDAFPQAVVRLSEFPE